VGLELPSGLPGGSPEEAAHSVPPEDVRRIAVHALLGPDRKLGHSGRQVRGTARQSEVRMLGHNRVIFASSACLF
jgi:hypothetical protein